MLKMSNKNKLLFWNNQKFITFKNIKLLSPQRNIKMINIVHQSPQKKLTQLTNRKNQEKMWLRKPTHLLSAQIRIFKQSTK